MKNLTEISQAVAKEHGLTSKKALAITTSVFRNFANGVIGLEPGSRERVIIKDVGSFGLVKTSERTVKRISDGSLVNVPAGVKVTFKAAQTLKDHALAKEPISENYEDPAEPKEEEAADADLENNSEETPEIPDIEDL